MILLGIFLWAVFSGHPVVALFLAVRYINAEAWGN